MKTKLITLIGAGVALLPIAVFAQGETKTDPKTDPKTGAQADARQIDSSKLVPPPYQLAADDVIGISVINFANLSVQNMVVPPDGNITVSLLEPFSVVGKTTDEVARILAEKWKKYVVNPAVSVSLISKRKENVLFYGFVTRVGTVEYRPTLRMVEALAQAGGAQTNGDLSHVTVTHKTGEKLVLDLSKPETRGGTEADVLLQMGDVVYVPERRVQISVLGEVNKPGSFDYKDEMTVLDAIASGGGVKMDTADFNGATLMHAGVESKLDLDALLKKGDLSQNVKLAAGDRIMVPEFKNRTYTFGAVSKAGYYPFKDGDRVLDALNASGGPVRDANIAKINIIRVDKEKNTAKVQVVDIEKALKQGKMEGNIALLPGDVIYIPDKKHKFGLDDVFRAVSAITGIDRLTSLLGVGLGR